jgi:hypothetical protein
MEHAHKKKIGPVLLRPFLLFFRLPCVTQMLFAFFLHVSHLSYPSVCFMRRLLLKKRKQKIEKTKLAFTKNAHIFFFCFVSVVLSSIATCLAFLFSPFLVSKRVKRAHNTSSVCRLRPFSFLLHTPLRVFFSLQNRVEKKSHDRGAEQKNSEKKKTAENRWCECVIPVALRWLSVLIFPIARLR